jgi:hypothetical protein
MQISTLALQNFKDYELLDSGNFLKLERFGQYILNPTRTASRLE